MKDNKIQITELSSAIAERRGKDISQMDFFIREIFALLESALRSESIVKLKGLGTFKLVRVEPRESININTGQRFTIDSHTKVSFVPDSTLRNQINKPFSEFQTVVLNEDVCLEEMERISIDDISEESADDVGQEIDDTVAINASDDVTESVVNEKATEDNMGNAIGDRVEDDVANNMKEEQIAESAVSKDVNTKQSAVESVMKQYVEAQHVNDMAVANQHIEHQTIEAKPMNNNDKRASSLTIWETMVMMTFVIAMIVLSYMAGYNRWLLDDEHGVLNKQSDVVAKIERQTRQKSSASTTHSANSAPKKPMVEPQSKPAVLEFPQVENGLYTIVGVIEEHRVGVGESLRGLSLKYYGSKDYVPYIVKMNNIANPDIVQLGMIIKLPKLQRLAD